MNNKILCNISLAIEKETTTFTAQFKTFHCNYFNTSTKEKRKNGLSLWTDITLFLHDVTPKAKWLLQYPVKLQWLTVMVYRWNHLCHWPFYVNYQQFYHCICKTMSCCTPMTSCYMLTAVCVSSCTPKTSCNLLRVVRVSCCTPMTSCKLLTAVRVSCCTPMTSCYLLTTVRVPCCTPTTRRYLLTDERVSCCTSMTSCYLLTAVRVSSCTLMTICYLLTDERVSCCTCTVTR